MALPAQLRPTSVPLSLALLVSSTSICEAAGTFFAEIDARLVTSTSISSITNWSLLGATDAPFNVVEPFTIGTRGFIFLLSSETGLGMTAEIDAQGDLTERSQISFGSDGWRAAQVWRSGGRTRVHVYNPRDGRTRRYEISDDGELLPNTLGDAQFDALENKHIVSGYTRGGQRRAFALDPFSGNVAIHAVGPQSIPTTAHFNLGWSDIDHLEIAGTTYRLLYKEVGSPFSEPADNPGAGRLVIVEVGADGLTSSTALDTDIGAGWSSVGLTRIGDRLAVYFYDRRSGNLVVRRYTGSTPTGITMTSQRNIRANFDRVVPVERDGQTFLVGVRFYPAMPAVEKMDGEPAAKFAACIEKKIGDRVPGYQLALLQNGTFLLDQARGYRKLSPSPVALRRDDRLNVGSVGKMITAVTAMRAHDFGAIDLDAPIASQFQAPYTLAPWVSSRTPRDLIAQTSGWDRDDVSGIKCIGDDATLIVDCSIPFTSSPPTTCASSNDLVNRQFACDYGYFNANFGMLRQIIQQPYFNIVTTPGYEALTKNLWLEAVLPDGPSCQPDPAVKRFKYCQAGSTCVSSASVPYEQSEPDPWNLSCAAGGWTIAAHDLARMVEQLFAEQVLSPQSTEELFASNWTDQGGLATGLGWEAPYLAHATNIASLGKNGSTGFEKAYVSTLNNFTSVALNLNASHSALRPTTLVQDAYRYAIGETSECRAADMTIELHSRTRSAASEVVTTYLADRYSYIVASRDPQGDLLLETYTQGADGSLVLAAEYHGESVRNLSVAQLSGGDFMVGFKNASGNLRIQLFTVGSNQTSLTKLNQYTGEAIRSVKLVHLDSFGAEVAAVMKTGAGKLKVAMFDRTSTQILRKAEYESNGQILGVDAASDPSSHRIVAAVRTTAGKQRLVVFDTDYSGSTLTRVSRSRDADERPGRQCRITFVPTDTGGMYVTSTLDSTGSLDVDAWSVSSSGQVTRRGWYPIFDVAESGVGLASGKANHAFVPFVSDSGRAKLFAFEVSDEGSLVLQTTLEPDVDDVTEVHAATRPVSGRQSILQAYLRGGDVRLTHWAYLDYE